ncbi:hypothetical protein BLX06_31985 [Bacillus cereus]|uniref:DDE domain-containing protein n=1 Tax=Bacillus cereus TaxID=1396 RepID=A0A9X6B348_BACCE|nr:hypothetical protein BLX06_31985 [Bacillus cereus]
MAMLPYPYPVAIRELKEEKCVLHSTPLRVKKYLNNIIEQDHRHVKRRFAESAGFQSIRHASRTIKGIEALHALYKRRRSLSQDFAFSSYQEVQQLMMIA